MCVDIYIQEAESRRTVLQDGSSSDSQQPAAAAVGPRARGMTALEYAEWMGNYPGIDFRLPSPSSTSPPFVNCKK